MAITGDWQAELNGVTLGKGTEFTFTAPISGLGIPSARTRDVQRGDLDGDVGGDDVMPRRVITIPLGITAATPELAMANFDALVAAWAVTAADLPLDIRLPGYGGTARRFFGRPRGVTPNFAALHAAEIGALCTFVALDPRAYGAEVNSPTNTGTFVINNAGGLKTERATCVITTGGGTPILTNATDSNGAIAFTATRPEYTVDLQARTVLDDLGNDAYSLLDSAATTWFDLLSGNNSLTVTGATNVDFTYRPAYL